MSDVLVFAAMFCAHTYVCCFLFFILIGNEQRHFTKFGTRIDNVSLGPTNLKTLFTQPLRKRAGKMVVSPSFRRNCIDEQVGMSSHVGRFLGCCANTRSR